MLLRYDSAISVTVVTIVAIVVQFVGRCLAVSVIVARVACVVVLGICTVIIVVLVIAVVVDGCVDFVVMVVVVVACLYDMAADVVVVVVLHIENSVILRSYPIHINIIMFDTHAMPMLH